MKLINRHPTTITITIAFITAALILLSHVSFSEQQQHSSSAESLSSDVDDDDHDQQHHHVDLQPPEVPSSAEAAESAHSEEEDSNSFELPSLSSPEFESPESAQPLPAEAPPEEPPSPPPLFEEQQSGNDAQEKEQSEPSPSSAQTTSTSDQPPQQPSSEEQAPSSATFSDLLAQYTPSMEQGQQTVEAVKRNGLLAYDYLQSAVLHLATLVPSVLVDSQNDDSTTKSESGSGPSGTSTKRPRENYALLSRFSWSALCSYYQSLAGLELELFCSTETAIAGVGVLLLLIFLLIRYTVGRGRPPKEEEVSENCTDPLSPSSSSSTASQSASPASSGLFFRLLRFLNLTILFSNLTSYVDGAFRSFRSSEAVVTQTSHGHAGVYSMQGRRPNMEDCFTLRNNISRELGIDYYAVFDGHGGPNAALQAEREIFENISRRIRELVAGEANKENNSSSQEQLSKSKSVPSSPTKPTSSSSSEGSCPATPSTTSSSSSPLTFSSMLNSGKALANNLSHNSLRPFDSLTVNAMKTILHEEITAVDAKLVEAFRRRGDISGTTAVIAVRLVHSNLLLVANVGDSRAVLCDWKGQAIVLSVDHKPYQLKEYRRIVEAGGYIMLKGVYRVNGILAVSRALGDYPLKEDRLVIADPDILSFDLTELRARFMIIASDGFFDCFSNENAVQFVRGELARHGTVNMGESQAGLALYLAKRLANEAYTRESYDNITIIVVLFEDVSGGGVQVKGVGQATCSSGGSSPTTKTAPTPLPPNSAASPKSSSTTTT